MGTALEVITCSKSLETVHQLIHLGQVINIRDDINTETYRRIKLEVLEDLRQKLNSYLIHVSKLKKAVFDNAFSIPLPIDVKQ